MITAAILYVFSFLLSVLANIAIFISQGWTIWPSSLLDGLTAFFTALMNFNNWLAVSEGLTALKYLIGFDAIYISIRLLMKLFNWIRGAGAIEV